MPRGRPKTHVAPCAYCSRQFKRVEHLRRHERIHTHEKPFECDCGVSFARKDLLVRHSRLAHADDNVGDEESSHSPGQDTVPSPEATGTFAAPLDAEPLNTSEPASGTGLPISQLPPDLSDHDAASTLVADNDGFEWLWQNDLYASNFNFGHYELQPMLLDPGNFGLANPVSMPVLADATATTGGEYRVPGTEVSDLPDLPSFLGAGPQPLANPPAALAGPSEETLPGPAGGGEGGPTPRWMLEGELAAAGDDCTRCPWRVSADAYQTITEKLERRKSHVPVHFTVPSRHTLSRYLEGYVRGFHEHLPFLHLPTFSASEVPEELLLSLAAVGAMYKFEHMSSHELFLAARALVSHNVQSIIPDSDSATSPGNSRSFNEPILAWNTPPASAQEAVAGGHGEPEYVSVTSPTPFPETQTAIATMQSINVLLAMASWGDGRLVPSAMELAGQLSTLLRLFQVSKADPISPELGWKEWIARESRRRTMLVGFALMNMQSVAFNTPGALMNQEIGLCLPHPMETWRAPTETKWTQSLARSSHRERDFRTILRFLLSGQDIPNAGEISAFGNFILMHGLLQQIIVDKQAASIRSSTAGLGDGLVTSLSKSLQCWQRCWSSSNESTLDPQSPEGPLAFNSTALLRIAYIRLVADLGPHRSVLIRNPAYLAKSVAQAPLPALQRSLHADFAVGQCIGALGILVRSGVNYVSRTYSHTWSIIHSLSHIECACFLSLWLRSIAEVIASEGPAGLRKDERRLLGMMTSMVAETDYADLLPPGGDGLATVRCLAAACVGIWAKVMRGEHVFQMVDNIAQGLSLAAGILTRSLQGNQADGLDEGGTLEAHDRQELVITSAG